jgi:hypothetical protein
MNAQVKLDNAGWNTSLRKVTGWHAATVRVKGRKRKGYALTSPTGVVGFIETLGPHPRIEQLLNEYTDVPLDFPGAVDFFEPRELMRDLLNAEDYRSDIYDAIVRVYYAEELANV